MADHPTPDEIRRAAFRVVFRGFEQEEVASYLDRLAAALEELAAERDRLRDRLGEFADRDLKEEFESVGREVTAVLEAARTAAEAMRDRASADATRWRSEAVAEVESMRREARADAEALRSDAWTTGTQLLDEVQAEVERQRVETERSALAIRGGAEREAHRLTSAARREAEEVLRAAKMEAERMVAQARVEHDDIISDAHRQAETAQERARALEERRHELMEELESVRAALASVEGELEERRQGVGLTEPPELPSRMVVAGEEGTEVKDWEEGGTVRVIRPGDTHEPAGEEEDGPDPGPDSPGDVDEEETASGERMAEEVARLHRREKTVLSAPPDAEPEPVAGEEPAPAEQQPGDEGSPEPGTEEERDSRPAEAAGGEAAAPRVDEVDYDTGEEGEDTGEEGDDVAELFRRLRQPSSGPEAGPPGEEQPGPDRQAEGPPPQETAVSGEWLSEGADPFEIRERILLPITNAALRSVKRSLADAQNEALEHLRIHGGDWSPDPDALDEAFREDLDTLVDQASQAGLEAAIELGITGLGSLQPASPDVDDAGQALVEALEGALEDAGDGARERQSAVSRVFRGWRTDEAERRVRDVALLAYHSALRQALESRGRSWHWTAYGRMCSTCQKAAESQETVPPAHRDCQCTIVPA
ncbi:MAG: DivIVA domain-containing protein [Actinomycetota bacterium]